MRSEFISPKELAQLGGVSMRTVRKWLSTGRVVYFQPGGPGTTVLIPKCRLRLDMLPTDFLEK
jgi:excisionase family DNA binding protein